MLASEVEEARGGLDLRGQHDGTGAAARCTSNGGCGWEGVPTYVRGKPSTRCPGCESGVDDDVINLELDAEERRRSLPKVGRNEPCPCGSGLKSKKCCYR